jgi:arabinogalactan oligomer/maltooligosaccharide transport system substrate-binding protein
MRRLLPATAAIAALTLTISACGGGEPAAPAPAPADPSKITGEVTWWDTTRPDSEGPTFQALIKQFESAYPGIKVKYVNVPSDQAQNQFQTAAQAGTGAPDVIRSEVAWTSQFASLGYLQALDGTRAVDKPEDFLPGPLSSTKYDGKTYAVPQVTDTLALIYNKRLLKEAGHEEPPKTVAELKQTALDVKAKTGAAGLALNVDSYFLLPFMYGEGGDLLDVAGKKIVVNSPANVKAMETVADLISSDAAPKPATTDSYANAMTAQRRARPR